MWEDTYQVYRRLGGHHVQLMASDMSIGDATLLVKAWMQENYNDQETSLEIRRKPRNLEPEPPKEEVKDFPPYLDYPIKPKEDDDGRIGKRCT